MRPTIIRLITGGALGVAFSISLTLPGSVVFPDEQPIRKLAAPEAPTATVLRATPVVRPRTAPTKPRVVVRRVYVPTAGTVRTTSFVRRTPPRPKPSRKPVERTPVAVKQPVTPLAAPPAASATEPAEEPQEADEQGDDEPRKHDRTRKSEKSKPEQPKKADKPQKSEKPKKAKNPKGHGSAKKNKPNGAGKEDRDDQGDDRGGHDKREHGNGRGGRGNRS
jgi:hypothetical protein